jgi:diguanylate cyclase (GGDEF)-like protein
MLEQNRRLEELTVTDALTGLANRRSLADNLERHLARFRRNGRPFCVLMLDLDHFKTVNDRHGHVVGDAVLCAFAATLAESVRSVDVVARYGGEEFTVILFETGRDEARESAERIRARVQEMRVEPEGGPALAVTVSIGIAEAGTADASAGDLLRRADQALYRAKRAGRNGVYFAEVRPEQPAPGGCGQGTRPSADSRRRS